MLNPLIKSVLLVALLGLPAAVSAMVSLEDEELSEHTGAAIAMGWQNVRFLAGPTTYLEALGDSTVPPVAPWKRGDLRWYGFGYSGVNPVSGYAGPCSAGISNLGCPIGDTIPYFMAFDNPMLIRVFDYTALRFGGTSLTQTVFEFLGPTNSSPFRYSWWSDLLVNSSTSSRLQGQAISNNVKLSTIDQPAPSTTRENMKIRIVRHTDAADQTLGFIWENHWSADFRFSVNQAFFSADTYGVAPVFTSTEGFYTLGIKVFFPIGQLHYQSLIVDDVAGTGNFRWEMTTPSSVGAYTNFYSPATGDTVGYERRDYTTGAYQQPNSSNLTLQNWYRTHAYFLYGDWYPTPTAFAAPNPTNANQWQAAGTANCPSASNTSGVGCNGRYSTSDGMFYVSYDLTAPAARFTAFSDTLNAADYDGGGNGTYGIARINNPWNGLTNAVNLGDSRIYGMLVNHLEIRTRGL